jgi:hypothetical protein
VAQTQCEAYAPALAADATVPANYKAACTYQARELYNASLRTGDAQTGGDGAYPIRVRPLTDAVKQMLRPQGGRPRFGTLTEEEESGATPEVVAGLEALIAAEAATAAANLAAATVTIEAEITGEATARAAADAALSADIDDEVTARAAAITAEALARSTADDVLADLIDAHGEPWTYSFMTGGTVTTSADATAPVALPGLSVNGLPDGLYEIEFVIFGSSTLDTNAVRGSVAWGASAPFTGMSFAASSTGITTNGVNNSGSPLQTSPATGPIDRQIIMRAMGFFRATSMSHAVSARVNSEIAGTSVSALMDSFLRYRRVSA